MTSVIRTAARNDIDFTDGRIAGCAGYTFLAEPAERAGLLFRLQSVINVNKTTERCH